LTILLKHGTTYELADEYEITRPVTPSVWVAAPEVGTPFCTWLFDAEGFNRVISSLSAGMQLSYSFYREKNKHWLPN
jgi:hypothetical protein